LKLYCSCSVVADETNGKVALGAGLKKLITNKDYVLLFFTFNFIYGVYSAMGTVISNLTVPYDYKVTDVSVFCLVFLIAGIFNSFFLGTLLDKY
jgi:hypothetical protein